MIDYKQQSEEIESDHYCGKRPTNVRLSHVIESSLLRADKEGYERGLEDAANIAKEIEQEIRQLKERIQ